MIKMQDEKIRTKWIEWIRVIHKNVQDLLTSQQMYKSYLEIVKNNPEIQSPIDFHDWVRKNYASSVASHIRRELDMGSDVISLMKLLSEIKEDPQCITKKWFESLYKGSTAEDYADHDFKTVA